MFWRCSCSSQILNPQLLSLTGARKNLSWRCIPCRCRGSVSSNRCVCVCFFSLCVCVCVCVCVFVFVFSGGWLGMVLRWHDIKAAACLQFAAGSLSYLRTTPAIHCIEPRSNPDHTYRRTAPCLANLCTCLLMRRLKCHELAASALGLAANVCFQQFPLALCLEPLTVKLPGWTAHPIRRSTSPSRLEGHYFIMSFRKLTSNTGPRMLVPGASRLGVHCRCFSVAGMKTPSCRSSMLR